jgi:hypothetical protein
MINIDKDKLCDEITDIVEKTASSGYNHAYAERLADELIERLVENLGLPSVSERLDSLIVEWDNNIMNVGFEDNRDLHKAQDELVALKRVKRIFDAR